MKRKYSLKQVVEDTEVTKDIDIKGTLFFFII